MTPALLTERQLRAVFRLALLICALAIAYLSFAPLAGLPETPSDKLDHFLAFWVLAWLANQSFPSRSLDPTKWILLLGYGLMIELIQGFLPYREPSFLDFVADVAGVLAYSIYLYLRRWSARRAEIVNER